MTTKQIRLKGWPAALVAVLAVGFVGYRALSAHSALEGPAKEKIIGHLQGVYTSHELPGLQEAYASGRTEELQERVDKVLTLDEIELTSLAVKGLGKDIVVKVGITVAGGPPPDGKSTRYYALRHRAVSGWQVTREITAFQYYLKLF